MTKLDRTAADRFVADTWAAEIVPALQHYITIPALSPAFDPAWEANGHLERAVEHVRAWMAGRSLAGMTVSVHRLPGRTPVIVADIPAFGPAAAAAGAGAGAGTAAPSVLLYGHLDKQPEMEGWRDGLGPVPAAVKVRIGASTHDRDVVFAAVLQAARAAARRQTIA